MNEVISSLLHQDQSIRDMMDFIICRDFCNLAENHSRYVAYKQERLSKMMGVSQIETKVESKLQHHQTSEVTRKQKDVQINKQQELRETPEKYEKKLESIEENLAQQKNQKQPLSNSSHKQSNVLPPSKQFSLLTEKYDAEIIMKDLQNKIQRFQPLVESDDEGCDYMLEDDAIGGDNINENNGLASNHVSRFHSKKEHEASSMGKRHQNQRISSQIAQILANQVRPKRMEYKQTTYERKPIQHVSESSSDGQMIIQDEDCIIGKSKTLAQPIQHPQDINSQHIEQVKVPEKKMRKKLESSSDQDLYIEEINE